MKSGRFYPVRMKFWQKLFWEEIERMLKKGKV